MSECVRGLVDMVPRHHWERYRRDVRQRPEPGPDGKYWLTRLSTATLAGGANYRDQLWTLPGTFVATSTTVQLCFTWTAYARTTANGSRTSDDIGTTVPTFACL